MTEDRDASRSLADRLDAALPPGLFDVSSTGDDPLVKAAALFAALPQPLMSPAASAQIRAQVLDAYRSEVYSSVFARSRITFALRWVAVVGVVLAVSLVGLTRAALASIPGDTLYPVKRAVEHVELVLATSDRAQASVHLTHAERRAKEALTLLDHRRWSPDLVITALDDMVAAADAARADPSMAASERVQLEARTVQVNTLVDSILVQAGQSGLVSQAALDSLVAEVHQIRTSGSLLLPPPVPTATPTPSPTPTPAPTGNATPTPPPSFTALPPVTPTARVSPTAPGMTETVTVAPTGEVSTEASPVAPISDEEHFLIPAFEEPAPLPITITIEGAVEAIEDNIITIDGIDIELAPDDPRLGAIRVGDVLQIEGESTSQGDKLTVVAINVFFVTADVAVGDVGQVWRDEGGCDNPPPSWAPARGWRQRCEGVQRPGNANDKEKDKDEGHSDD